MGGRRLMERIEKKLDDIDSKLTKHINHDYHELLTEVTGIKGTVKTIQEKVAHTNKYIVGGSIGLLTSIVYLIIAIVR